MKHYDHKSMLAYLQWGALLIVSVFTFGFSNDNNPGRLQQPTAQIQKFTPLHFVNLRILRDPKGGDARTVWWQRSVATRAVK